MSAMTCSSCGLPNEANARTCVRCGAALSAWAPPSQANPGPPAKSRSTTATIVIVLAVVLGIGLVLVGIVAAIAIPSLIRARAAANEASAIGTLRRLSSAEDLYRDRNDKYGTLADLRRENYIDPTLSDGAVVNGYAFHEVKVTSDTFEFSAEPTDERTTGDRAYNVTEDLVIRYQQGTKAPRGTSGKVLGAD